jgi:hypothetical protein
MPLELYKLEIYGNEMIEYTFCAKVSTSKIIVATVVVFPRLLK